MSTRKTVIFDGVCVLCNTAGSTMLRHLPDRNLISFLPFQDALSNPHVSLKRIKAEFPDFDEQELTNRICVLSGDKMLWGADAVIEACSWMYAPFPVMKLGLLVPGPIRDALYITVAKNRYEWFGTQPLEQNFAKNLCPYLYVRKFMEPKED